MKKFNNVCSLISTFALIVMATLVSLEVVCRSFFGFSTLFATEYSKYMLAVCIFIGAAYSVQKGDFIHVDLIYQFFYGKFKKTLDIILWVSAIAYLVFVTYYLYLYVYTNFLFGATANEYYATPLWIPQSVMVIGMVILAVYCCLELYRALKAPLKAKPKKGLVANLVETAVQVEAKEGP